MDEGSKEINYAAYNNTPTLSTFFPRRDYIMEDKKREKILKKYFRGVCIVICYVLGMFAFTFIAAICLVILTGGNL